MLYTSIEQYTIATHHIPFSEQNKIAIHRVKQFNIATPNAYLQQQRHICTQYTLL